MSWNVVSIGNMRSREVQTSLRGTLVDYVAQLIHGDRSLVYQRNKYADIIFY